MIRFTPHLKVYAVEPNSATPQTRDLLYIDENNVPLLASGSSSIFCVHFADNWMPVPGPVTKLTFNHLGSADVPDLRRHADTCKALAFKGKIHSAKSVFEITHQLPNVKEVDILIDAAQSTYSEVYSQYVVTTPYCPHVESLKITMNLDYFYGNFPHQCDPVLLANTQNALVLFAETLLKHAADSFANLKKLTLKLPENPKLRNAVKCLYVACPKLKKERLQAVPENQVPTTNNNIFEPFGIGNLQYLPSPESIPWNTNSLPAAASNSVSPNQLQPLPFAHIISSNNANVGTQSSEQQVVSPFPDFGSMFLHPYQANHAVHAAEEPVVNIY